MRAAPVSETEEKVRRAGCAKCGARPGQACRTPKGMSQQVAHLARRESAIELGYHQP